MWITNRIIDKENKMISRYLDHAVLKPEMTEAEVIAAIQNGIDNKVKTVCVRPCDIELAKGMCKGTETEVICVLDFPHGTGGADAKEALAKIYAAQGVAEIDMVMNYGYARSGKWDAVEDEISRVVAVGHGAGIPVKVILETSELSAQEITQATEICAKVGADFVKTSTGFSKHGATVDAVRTMLDAADGRISVKASGGVRDYETAKMYVDMGVARIGNGSGSTDAIVAGEPKA